MIGVFDSGFGGLTVLKEFLSVLPEYDYVYLGDNARAPYGGKSQKEIYQYACEGMEFLFGKGCDLAIVACNTASAKALRKIQQKFLPKHYPDKKVLGVIIPTAEEIGEKGIKRVGIIGTESTVKSKTYIKELEKIDKDIKVFQKACPELAPLIERGKAKEAGTKKKIGAYLDYFKNKKIDALILGCTHYPIIKKEIQEIMGEIEIISPPAIIVGKLKDYLERHKEIERKLEKNKKRFFYTTGDIKKFSGLGGKFLGRRIKIVKKTVISSGCERSR
ncbi:MAG: glutamate racemase [Patescibacteria group bacterium]